MNDENDTLDTALDADVSDDAETLGDASRKKGGSWVDPEPVP